MTTAREVIRAARGEVGYHEGRSGGHWNNREKYAAEVPTLAWVSAGGYAWCAVFVCWCFNKAGALEIIPGGPTASVAHFRDYAKQAGRFSEYPAVGAIILYGQNGDAHTGIVVSYDDTSVVTIEGNTNADGSPEGDGVYRKVHRRTDDWVYGYAYPDFPEGIDSADPKWQRQERVAKPSAPTRVTRARSRFRTGLHVLTAAVRHGRKGRVKKARDRIRHIVNHVLPKR